MNINEWSQLICHNNLTNKEISDKFIDFYINWILRCVKDSNKQKLILKLTEPTLKHREKIYKLIYELSIENKNVYIPWVNRGIA